MANNTITFNPDSSAEAYGVNLVISTRTDFTSTFKVVRPDKSNFDFTSYSGSSQMAKSASIGSSLRVLLVILLLVSLVRLMVNLNSQCQKVETR